MLFFFHYGLAQENSLYQLLAFELQESANLLMKHNFQGQVPSVACVRKDEPECVSFYQVH